MFALLINAVCAFAHHDASIVTIQKDEGQYLQDWIDWHSFLLGSDALTVIDHDSKDSTTQLVLEQLKGNRVNLVNYQGPFTEKHVILTKVLKQKNTSLVIPLDRASILDTQFEKFKLGVSQTSCDWPLNTSCRISQRTPTSSREKTYYRRSTFVNTDQGNHFGKSLHDTVQPTRYVCIYHRSKPPDLMWAKSIRNALSYGYFSKSNVTYVQRKTCNGNGMHYCQYVLKHASAHGARVRSNGLSRARNSPSTARKSSVK